MTNLKDINFGLNQYCDPAVLSALTGKSTDECASVIMSITNKAEVRAVDMPALIKALEKLRFNVEETKFAGGSLFGTLHRLHTFDGLYIVTVPKHVVAIEVKDCEIYICDNHTKTPLDIKQSSRLMQKCESVYKVVAKPEPVFLGTKIEIIKYHSNNIHIVAWDIFNDSKISRRLGQFTFKDKEELVNIASKITDLVLYNE